MTSRLKTLVTGAGIILGLIATGFAFVSLVAPRSVGNILVEIYDLPTQPPVAVTVIREVVATPTPDGNNPVDVAMVEVTRLVPVTVVVTEQIIVTSTPPPETQTPIPTRTSSPTPTQVPPPDFFEDFSDPITAPWENENNAWITSGGLAVPQACGLFVVGDENWNNFVMDFDFVPGVSLNGLVLLGFEDDENYVALQLSPSSSYWIREENNSSARFLSTKEWPLRIERDELYHLRVEVQDPAVRVYINDVAEPVWDITTPISASGKVGFYSCSESNIRIDNFLVTPLQ